MYVDDDPFKISVYLSIFLFAYKKPNHVCLGSGFLLYYCKWSFNVNAIFS